MQASIDEAQKHEYGIGRSMQAWGLDFLKLINFVEHLAKRNCPGAC